MKFLLLKILLIRRGKDEGFTLPIVMAIGLVMLLLTTVNLIQSGEEQLVTIAKKGSSDALASAEFGIARYRELLNNNRVLAVYNLDQWTTTNISGQTCDNISDSAGEWADNSSTTWRKITLDETDFSLDFNGDGDEDDETVDIGEYQIVDYIYTRDDDINDSDDNGVFDLLADINNDTDGDGDSDARGLLTVKGRSRDGSEAQIQVEIPVGVNVDDLETLNPALWIRQSTLTPTKLGNVNLDKNGNGTNNETGDGNLVIYRASSGNSRCDETSIATSPTATPAIRDPRNLPNLVDIDNIPNKRIIAGTINLETDPDNAAPTAITDPDNRRDNFFKNGEILLGNELDDADNVDNTLGTATDTDNTALNDGRYYYKTTGDLTIGAGESIRVDGTAKVILYVDGDLNIDTGTGDEVALANSSNNATSRYLEIHVFGDVNINGSGTVQISGLLLAPNGTVNIGGSATLDLTGSIWANNWDNSGTVNITDARNDYKYYSVTPERTPKPLTYRPSNWETQEVE